MPVTANMIGRGAAGRAAAVAAALVTLAGTAAAAAVPVGRSAGRAAGVPWRLAGPGWSVVEYSAASLAAGSATARTVFYLVSPAGRKWAAYRSPTATTSPVLILDDWSGDRRRILVDGLGSGQRDVAEQISLAAGAVVSRFRFPADVLPVGYTRPRGSDIVALGNGNGILVYDLTGRLRRVLARRLLVTWALDSPRGRFFVAGTLTGLAKVGNAGAVIRRVRAPVPVHSCDPVRWWTASTVLADCFGRSPYDNDRLWLFGFGGGRPVPLTPRLHSHGLFQGYINAWKLGRRLYLQADDAHDTLSIVRQFRNGARRAIVVPGPAGFSPFIVTAYRGRLLLESDVGPGGPSSLIWFDPAARSVRFIFRAAPGTFGVAGAIAYGYWNG